MGGWWSRKQFRMPAHKLWIVLGHSALWRIRRKSGGFSQPAQTRKGRLRTVHTTMHELGKALCRPRMERGTRWTRRSRWTRWTR